jgi:hypothetical protein
MPEATHPDKWKDERYRCAKDCCDQGVFYKDNTGRDCILPLANIAVDASVSGSFCTYDVVCTYKNKTKNELDIVYLYPFSRQETISKLKVTMGDKVILTKVKNKKAAI